MSSGEREYDTAAAWFSRVLRNLRYDEFGKARANGTRWLIECRDRCSADKSNDYLSVFFVNCRDEDEVREKLAILLIDEWTLVDGVFDTSISWDLQKGAVKPEEWLKTYG